LRHQVVWILRLDALDEFALFGMAGNNCVGMAWAFSESRLFQIEPQARLAHFGVGPMATEAVAGQNGLDILVEIKMLRNLRCGPVRLPVVAADSQHEESKYPT
jgi:hypothetical protein